jgi:Fe2+ transport system protein FeoA
MKKNCWCLRKKLSERNSLATMKSGQKGKVVSVCSRSRMAGRLAAMGITPGVDVEVLSCSGDGPLVVVVRGARMCLCRNMADKVQVDPT